MYPLRIIKDFTQFRPSIGNFAVIVAFVGVVHIWVNPSLEDLEEVAGFSSRLITIGRQVEKMIKECRNVTEIKNAWIAKIDRFRQESFSRNHTQAHHLPGGPEFFPLCK